MIAQRFTTTPSGLESAPVGAKPARRLALVPAEEGSGRPGVRRYRLSRGGAAADRPRDGAVTPRPPTRT